MPAIIVERTKSRRSQIAVDSAGGSIDLNYYVLGTNNDIAVRALVEAAVAPIYGGMYFHYYTIEPTGKTMWDVKVSYFSSLPKSATQITRQFDTTGGTQHITVSRKTIKAYSLDPPNEAPDYQGAIGVNGDSVEGCDVTIPQFNFSLTAYIPQALITPAYRALLFNLTGKTNQDDWDGFERGEVLFLGAQGSVRGLENWEITFKFAASVNRLNSLAGGDKRLPIGRSDLKVDKRGWEYLWIRYADKVDANAKAIVRVPVAAYVEQVYDEADFLLLGIGG